MKIVLFTGGRDYANYDMVQAVMQEVTKRYGMFMILQGGARGADRLCKLWGEQNGYPVINVDANWNYYGNQIAGSKRNGWMLALSPSYCVAFPGGRGTANMVFKAESAGIVVWKIDR